MGIKVAKFGGSSVASADQVRKVAAILAADPDRRYFVSSAPGKQTGDDAKVTDLLYRLHQQRTGDYTATLTTLRRRFTDIAAGLGVSPDRLDFEAEFAAIEEQLVSGASRSWLASRGEYLHCRLIAAYLDWPFVDAADVIRFSKSGELLAAQTDELLARSLTGLERAVIPGFYGATADGSVRTFSRGGSDVTGALVARVVGAEVYENWTDVSGILMADPRIVDSPRSIERLSYTALRELTYLTGPRTPAPGSRPTPRRSGPTTRPSSGWPASRATPPSPCASPSGAGCPGSPAPSSTSSARPTSSSTWR